MHAMAGHERVDDQNIDLIIGYGFYDCLHDRYIHLHFTPDFFCDDDRLNTSGVQEQPITNVVRLELEMFDGGREPAIEFFQRVFTVPVPDTELAPFRLYLRVIPSSGLPLTIAKASAITNDDLPTPPVLIVSEVNCLI